MVYTEIREIKQGMESKIKLRRVSQRLSPAYCSTKQVTAVARGSCHIPWKANQNILVDVSLAALSRTNPMIHSTLKRVAIASG